jgi:hypothetical protein
MHLLSILLIVTIILFVSCMIFVLRRNKKLISDNSLLKTMFDNVNSYVFLIDDKVEVKKTNYYSLNPHIKHDQPLILGNVLRCKNGCDAGFCGTSPYCSKCPIRVNITKSLIGKENFADLETHMQLYTPNHNTVETDVIVDGKYIEINDKPHMVIGVKDITPTKTLQRMYLEEKLKSQRDSKRYQSMINKIISNIKSPFTALNGYVGMFLHAHTDEERTNSAKFIGTHSYFINNWLNDFLNHDLDDKDLNVGEETEKLQNKSDNTYSELLPKLLVSTTDDSIYNKVKDFTVNKFNVEIKQTDVDIAAYAVALYNVYAVVTFLPVDRADTLVRTLHSLKPKLPIVVLINVENKDLINKYSNDPCVFCLNSNFSQKDLIRSLELLEVK